MNKIKPASKKGTRKNASVKHLKPEKKQQRIAAQQPAAKQKKMQQFTSGEATACTWQATMNRVRIPQRKKDKEKRFNETVETNLKEMAAKGNGLSSSQWKTEEKATVQFQWATARTRTIAATSRMGFADLAQNAAYKPGQLREEATRKPRNHPQRVTHSCLGKTEKRTDGKINMNRKTPSPGCLN